MELLNVKEVKAGYGQVEVLHGISFNVKEKEVVSVIGGNGAGKTTLLRTISGLVACRDGEIHFKDQEISKNPHPYRVVELGLVHAPEGRQVFGNLTVWENLILGSYSRYYKIGKEGRKKLIEFVFGFFPRLAERKNQTADCLSGGEQQMLSIGRALMGKPELLLLDEPSLGLAPTIVENIFEKLRELSSKGLAILLVEQNARLALELAGRGYVISLGNIVLEGKASDLSNDDRVRQIYLGRAKA